MLARCNVPLRDLLKSKPRLSMDKYPMVSPQTGEVIAHLKFDARLAMPISELYRLFLERHPGQRKLIEDMSNKRFLEGKDAAAPTPIVVEGSKEDESRMYNELEILILKLSNLVDVATDTKPSLYTYFQLLGYPEKFTNPVMNSADPVFNEKFSFPMITNDHQIRLLERSPLHIIIMDLKKEENVDPSIDGFVGEVTVSLAQLNDGLINNDTFSVRDRSGKKVADLELSIRWKHPLRKQRELGPRALGAIDVECLMNAFSHGDLYTGLVDYRSFCRFINPPKSAKIAIDFLRKFVSKTSDKEGLSAKDVIRGITGNSNEMSEDEFLQKLLRLDSEILPSDYTALFRFIDVLKVGTVSVDQLIAILNLDEEVKIPAALQEKLFQRVNDLLMRSIVPITLFESEDRWGVDGCISRAEFKHGLRKMGYQLVDEEEAPEGESLLINHQLQSRGATPQRHELLDDTTISDGNDEILIPLGSHPEHHEMNGGGGVETSKAKILQDHKKKQIEFKQRMSEVQVRSQKTAANAGERAKLSDGVDHPSSTELPPSSRRASPFDSQRMDHIDLNPGDFKQRQHRTTLANEDNGRREYDQTLLDQSATKLQSTFRGHISRKQGSSTPRGSPQKKAPLKVSEDGILIAEDSLRFQLESNGARVVADLTKEFQVVDSRRSGIVNKKQFAFVLSKVPALKLEPNDLLAIMKYFDKSSDCTDIDYNAFLGFCKYRIPEKSNVLMILDQMIITDNNIEFMRTMDSNGSGFMRRADMLRALTTFGYGHVGKSDFLDMVALFETREEGLVNYLNFSEFVSENNISRAFKDVENSLKAMFTQGSLLDWFKQIDSRNEGVIGVERFRDFLIGQGFEMSKEMIMAIISDMDTENLGVHFAHFKGWATKVSRPHDVAFHGDLSNTDLKSKAQKYVIWVNKRGPAAIDHILQCFLLYDWPKPPTGFVRKSEFYRACYRAGFVFTESELHKLSSQFSNDAYNKSSKVRYRDFLDWCMVNPRDVTGSDSVHPKRPVDSSRNVTSLVMRCLEHQIKKGVDLLSVFGRFDSKVVGRISADEFCSALADLGLSSVTQRDALDFAEIFKAAPGSNFIMYRRIITELLSKFDENSGAADIDIVDSICNTLLKRRIPLTKVRDALEHYDSKLTGTIRSEDVGTAFEDLRVVLRRQEIEALCNRYAAGDIYRLQYHPLLADLQSKIGDEELPLVVQVPTEIVTKIRGSLETLIIKGVDYCSEFERVSESVDGRVSQAEFKEALLGRLNISLSSHELQVLASSFRDEKDPRRVHFLKMLHVCHPLTRPTNDYTLWSISETLRHKIRRRCDFNAPGELRRPFNHFCKKMSKNITRESFAIGIRDIGIQLDTDQERDLFDMLAQRKDAQSVTYSEFKVFVCDPFHRDVLWNFTRAKKRSGVNERELVEAIKRMDTSDSGLITSQQCAKILVKNGIELSDADVNRLMVRFDSEEQQRFEILEFVRFLRGDNDEDMAGGDRSDHDRLKDDAETRRYDRRQDDEDDMDDSAVLLSLRRAVKKKLAEGYTANEIFSTFDPENRRTLDLASLQSGAREYGVTISRLEARTILRKMGLAAGGVVDKTSFLISLGIEKDNSGARKASSRFNDASADDELMRRHEHRRPSDSSTTELKVSIINCALYSMQGIQQILS
jgi:Ca2+-binding EF-hand superfamily protein